MPKCDKCGTNLIYANGEFTIHFNHGQKLCEDCFFEILKNEKN